MDALRSAIPLARLLLAVAEGGRDAVVCVRARARVAHVHVVRGALVRVDGVDGEPLGDALLRRGVLDATRHRDALQREPPAGRVGPWLVAVGAAPKDAVQRALEDQLEDRIATLLRWPDALFELSQDVAPTGYDADVRGDLICAVWQGLLQLAAELPIGRLSTLAGDLPLAPTRSGERLLQALERAGERLDRAALLRRAPASNHRPARAVLRALGAVTEAGLAGDACSLLLRKQRQIRNRAPARALLDLPPHAAPEQVRPALRRLAGKLHPDRFQGADPGLCAVSSEVMRALAQAERELLSAARMR